MTIFGDEVGLTLEYVAQDCKDGIPDRSAKECIAKESTKIHFRQTGRDGDKLANARHHTADERSYITMFAEIIFSSLDFLTGE